MPWNKKINWLFPLASAALAIVSIAVPVAFSPKTGGKGIMFWYWALNVDTRDGDVFYNTDEIAMAGAVLETAVLAIAAILMAWTSVTMKKGIQSKMVPILLLVSAILLVASPVGYIIGAEVYRSGFWLDNYGLFGMYGPFIAAGLAVVCMYLVKMN